ncbi:hypothetical protein HanIR_Chr17g0868811 [Helianthus annuus]|nr:hypothetical protein HanIR_Chr17g0868811 [Helianthus annuus]
MCCFTMNFSWASITLWPHVIVTCEKLLWAWCSTCEKTTMLFTCVGAPDSFMQHF